jgi:hypothetical protein
MLWEIGERRKRPLMFLFSSGPSVLGTSRLPGFSLSRFSLTRARFKNTVGVGFGSGLQGLKPRFSFGLWRHG